MINKFKRIVASCATNALKQELDTKVKFGLVCPTHNGSHKDLNYELMNKSIDTLYDGFMQLVQVGYDLVDQKDFLKEAREQGKIIEKNMFKATNGVNTHKGALFCLGLFCVAIGVLFKLGKKFDALACSELIAKSCQGICQRELSQITTPITHGEKIFAKYSVKGARQLAEEGFCQIIEDFLPKWKSIKNTQKDYELAKTQFLAYVMYNTQDVNVIYRSNMQTLLVAQNKCKELYDDFNIDKAKKTEKWFVDNNLSCGGSADLLALTLFLDNMAQRYDESQPTTPKKR